MDLIQKYYLPWHFPFRKELAGILLILLIFLLFPRLVRQVDYTAAPIDPGALSAVILAIAAMLFFKAVTWWLLKTIWPVFADYSDNHFERNFKSLLSLHKVLIYLVFYLALLYGFVLVLVAIL
jgi:succinate dehydrogenase hydrophobic anchor subunit